jgi:hypothetical protein
VEQRGRERAAALLGYVGRARKKIGKHTLHSFVNPCYRIYRHRATALFGNATGGCEAAPTRRSDRQFRGAATIPKIDAVPSCARTGEISLLRLEIEISAM